MNKADSRRKNLLEFLNKRGYATIEELAQQFDVTPQTMRRDINQLADAIQQRLVQLSRQKEAAYA